MKSVRQLFLGALGLLCLNPLAQAEALRLELPGPEYAVPVKVYLPENVSGPAPVVLFSHGLGGSREGAAYLGEHWAAAGYVVVAIQHPGSDASVWENLPKWKRWRALKRAADLESFMNRLSDVDVVLDYLERSVCSQKHRLHQRLDTSRVAMSGHSFGAITSQAIMGQNFRGRPDALFQDERVDCVILMSPSPSKGLDDEAAFGAVTLPVLCMTGTEDGSALSREITPESRKQVYTALPEGQAYPVVFNQGRHSIFSDYQTNDPRYHDAIETLTTAFLDAYLKQDPAALDWLHSDEVLESLASEDRWESK